MKKLLSVLLIAVLLFTAGCNKKDDTPDTPDTPPAPEDTLPDPTPETPVGPETPIVPDDTAEAIFPEDKHEPAIVTATLIDAADGWLEALTAERQAVTQFLQGELPDGTVIEAVLDAYPVEGEGWDITVVETFEGQRTRVRYTARIVPDGKGYLLEELTRTEQSAAWRAVQNYRALYSALSVSPETMLRALGFDPDSNVIFFNDFIEAMQTVMTPDLYNTAWVGVFDSREGGLLTWKDDSGDGLFYAVDRVEQQPDGVWLSFEHYYDADGVRYDYTVRVELLTQEDGTCVVSDWHGHNVNVHDRSGDGALQAAEFPVPTGEAMGLSGEDAALYTAISHSLLDKAYPENAGFGNDLVLTSVDLLGKYEGENGLAHYVCRLNDSHFYDAGSNSSLQYSSLGRIARVTLNADGMLAEFLPTLDGADNTDRLTEIFGPLTAQREALEKNQIIPGARRLLPTGEILLALYKAAYFPGF